MWNISCSASQFLSSIKLGEKNWVTHLYIHYKVGPRFETYIETKTVKPSYGVLVTATDSETNSWVAIRKIPLRDQVSRERALREVMLCKRLKHKNITTLVDLIINPAAMNPMVFFLFQSYLFVISMKIILIWL